MDTISHPGRKVELVDVFETRRRARRETIKRVLWDIVGWTIVAILAVGLIGGVVTVVHGLHVLHTSTILVPCPTEDSGDDCVWDAETRGNGTGESFIVLDGTVYRP